MEIDEARILDLSRESSLINKGAIHKDFGENDTAQLFLAVIDDYSRRLLNLTESLTFIRMRLEMRDDLIASLKEEILELKKPKKKK